MRYFEDIEVGAEETSGPYVLTKQGIVEFSAQWDPLDFHTNSEAAEGSMFECLTASGVHTACIANQLGHDMQPTAVRA